MDDALFVGMLDVHPAPGNEQIAPGRGAFAYCAGRAPDLGAFLARLTETAAAERLELQAVDWIARHADLDESARRSDAVRAVVDRALDHEGVVFDHFHGYPQEPEPEELRLEALREQAERFVGNWIEGAVEHFEGAFELGNYAFVAELRFPEGTEIGWATTQGNPAPLLRRAADAADQRARG